MNVRGRNLFGRAAEDEVKKRTFREVPYSYPDNDDGAENPNQKTKSVPSQKVGGFDESAANVNQSGLVTYPMVHIGKRNYEKYLRHIGKTVDDVKRDERQSRKIRSSERSKSDSLQKSRSVSAVSFKIKTSEASVKLQNKTESFEFLKSAYGDDEEEDETGNQNDRKRKPSARNRGTDDDTVFKKPMAMALPPNPNLDQLKDLDPDKFDKISELLAQKEFIENQLKSIAEIDDEDVPSDTFHEENLYDSQRNKYSDFHDRTKQDKNTREDDYYKKRRKDREYNRSPSDPSRSHSDYHRSDYRLERDVERYHEPRSDLSYPRSERHRTDHKQMRSSDVFDKSTKETDPEYYRRYPSDFSARENKDLPTLEREYQEFSETVGVQDSTNYPSHREGVVKTSESGYPTDLLSGQYNEQYLQPEYHNYQPVRQGLLPTPGSTEIESDAKYRTPYSSGQALLPTPGSGQALLPTPVTGQSLLPTPATGQSLLPTPVTGQGLLPTPISGANSVTEKIVTQPVFQDKFLQGLLPTPTGGVKSKDEHNNPSRSDKPALDKPFEEIKKTLNLLNIKLTESKKPETVVKNPIPLSSVALDDISESISSAKKQLEYLTKQEYGQNKQDQVQYKRVLPPELRNTEQPYTDYDSSYQEGKYDSWRDSGHKQYGEDFPPHKSDHSETSFDRDVYYRGEPYAEHQDFERSQDYDARYHDPYPPDYRSREFDDFKHGTENFEARKPHYDSFDSDMRKQSVPPSGAKPNYPPSLMSLNVSPTKNIGKPSKQANTARPNGQTSTISEDQRWNEEQNYENPYEEDPDYNPYLDENQDDDYIQPEQHSRRNEYFDEDIRKYRPTRFDEPSYQKQSNDYPMDVIASKAMPVPEDRSHFENRPPKREFNREDFNRFGRDSTAQTFSDFDSGNQYPEKIPESHRDRKRKSRFDSDIAKDTRDNYGYSDQRDYPGYRNEGIQDIQMESTDLSYGYEESTVAEWKWDSYDNQIEFAESDSSLLLNVRGALSETVETHEESALFPESSYNDFNAPGQNRHLVPDYSHTSTYDTNIEQTSTMDQHVFGAQSGPIKRPGVPGRRPMRGMNNSKPFPRSGNLEQHISKPIPKHQNTEQINTKPFPKSREPVMPKPLPRPPPKNDSKNAQSDTRNRNNMPKTADSANKKISDLSACGTKVDKPNEAAAKRQNNKEERDTFNRGKRPASQSGKNEDPPAAKQKKGGCVNCGSFDHIKCPKARKTAVEGTPKYGEQHGLPKNWIPQERGAGANSKDGNIKQPVQKKESPSQGKNTSSSNPVREDKAQENKVQRHPEASWNCIENLRNYFKNTKSSDDPVSALTAVITAKSINHSYKETVVKSEGKSEIVSAALTVHTGIFLARGASLNRNDLKKTVYWTALKNLLKKSTNEILDQKDPGPYDFPISENLYKQLKEGNTKDRVKPDLVAKARTPGLSDAEFEEIIRKEREDRTVSVQDMILGLKAREKYREENKMNPSLDTILTNPKIESNAKDIEGRKCTSDSKDIKKLIIVQHENIDKYKKGQSFEILRYSATQCGMLLQWWRKCVYTKHPFIYRCSIWLEKQFLGEAYSTGFDDSRTLAANSILSELYPNHPVISVKRGKTPAASVTIQYKEISEKVKILMMATGEKMPDQRPKINDWIIQMCKEHITEYKDSDTVEMLRFTPGYTDEEVALIQSFAIAMGLRCNHQKGKPIFVYKLIDPEVILKKLQKTGSTDKNYRLLDNKEKRTAVEMLKN